MKEKQFIKNLEEINFNNGLIIPVYYSVDKKGDIVLDEEGIILECKNKIEEIKGLLE